MAGNCSRNRGNKWETDCARKLREIGYTDVRTSRECSRLRDSKKVDLCNADEDEFGRLPFNFQCKSYSKVLDYKLLLKELDEHNGRKQANIILHQYTVKSAKGKFMTKGEWAIFEGIDMGLLYKSPKVREFIGMFKILSVDHTVSHKHNYVKSFDKKDIDMLFITHPKDKRPNMLVIRMDVFWEILKIYKNGEPISS